MVFDVRGDMLVVWISDGKRRVIWVGERIVPVEFVLMRIARLAILGRRGEIGIIRRCIGLRNLIAVALNDSQLEIEVLVYAEDNTLVKKKAALNPAKERTGWNVD